MMTTQYNTNMTRAHPVRAPVSLRAPRPAPAIRLVRLPRKQGGQGYPSPGLAGITDPHIFHTGDMAQVL